MEGLLLQQRSLLYNSVKVAEDFMNVYSKIHKGIKKDLGKLFKLYYFMYTKRLNDIKSVFLTESKLYSLATDAKWAANIFCRYSIKQAKQVIKELDFVLDNKIFNIGQCLSIFARSQIILDNLNYFYSHEGCKRIDYLYKNLHTVVQSYANHYDLKKALSSRINWQPLQVELQRCFAVDIYQNIINHEMGRAFSTASLDTLLNAVNKYYVESYNANLVNSYAEYQQIKDVLKESLSLLFAVPNLQIQNSLNIFKNRKTLPKTIENHVFIYYGMINAREEFLYYYGDSFKGRMTDIFMFFPIEVTTKKIPA